MQEGLLICIICAGSATIYQADRLFKQKLEEKNKNPIQAGTQRETIEHEFWLRFDTLKTYSSLLLLVFGILNYFFSFFFALGFHRYHSSLDHQSRVNCEVAGAFPLISYSVFLILPSGSMCLIIYILAGFYKIFHLALLQICPVRITNLKQDWNGIPTANYDHYKGQFDFEVDLNNEREPEGENVVTKQNLGERSQLIRQQDEEREPLIAH